MKKNLSKLKLLLFYLIGILLSLTLVIAILISSNVINKLTKSYSYCNSYGERDYKLGWVLKKSHISCLSLKNHILQKNYFDTEIFLNQYGFRDKFITNEDTPRIIFIGDSWTFGYGVNSEKSFPSLVGSKTKMSVFNMGVPNYSSLQSIYLYKRFEDKFKPKYVVFLNPNTLTRALCAKENYIYTLEPCYSLKNNKVEIYFPNKSFIEEAKNKKIYPSGFHTSGYNFFEYYFTYQPVKIFRELKKKYGSYNDSYEAEVLPKYFTKDEMSLIRDKELYLLSNISTQETTLINIMMHSDHYNENSIKEAELNHKFINYNHKWFEKNIIEKFANIKNFGKIEVDGHYNEEANEIIATEIAKLINTLEN